MSNKFTKAFDTVLNYARSRDNGTKFRKHWRGAVESAIKQGVRREDAVAASLTIYTYPDNFGIILD